MYAHAVPNINFVYTYPAGFSYIIVIEGNINGPGE